MSAYVVVHLASTRRAKRTHGEHAALTHHKVKRLLTEHGAELVTSPDATTATAEPSASASATIAVPDMARADKLAAALREVEGIETAYAKPGEELP